MAHTISPQELTEKFIAQFTNKLKSSGLITLLNSHLQQKDTDSSILQIDPSVLDLHLELLAYENAIIVASSFPTKLAQRLAYQRGNIPDPKKQSYSTAAAQATVPYANGTISKKDPQYTPASATVQATDPFANDSSTKSDTFYAPASTVQSALSYTNSTKTTEPDQTYFSSSKEATKQPGGETTRKSAPRPDSGGRSSLTRETSRSTMSPVPGTGTGTGTTNGSKSGFFGN
ncbi:hypothetical protein AYL99_04583 [Fonsecaea erecta]|uniref:Uncharacterized protein n=1 Tax=Fonsecaea erecta TaxID=1367422 RepID=A0A178ZRE2_9EURO|nr:hypothetical protein AYL99_04583 [Fonsecaea erecta]OAP62380.1 hypothetical protein AYL99_04583 [Fonsecaea erecta]